MATQTVKFRCPACSSERDVSRKVLGRRVRCPDCGHVSRVEESQEAGDGEQFDAYYHWLAIPPAEQPPTFYRLLGVAPFEQDPDVIAMAADRQMLHVKAQSSGRYGEASQMLLNELAKARACLLDDAKRQAYEEELRAKQSPAKKKSKPSQQRARRNETRPEAIQVDAQQAVAAPAAAAPTERWNGERPADPDAAESNPDLGVSFGGEKDDMEAEMDMTPMVDVTFLLLIFFMVTAAFTLQKTIPMPAESEDPSQNVVQLDEEDPDVVQVFVDALNTYYVRTADWEEEAPSEHEMLVKVRRAREGEGGEQPTRMVVKAHGDALYEKVIAAMDAGSQVGFEQVNVAMTEEDFE